MRLESISHVIPSFVIPMGLSAMLGWGCASAPAPAPASAEQATPPPGAAEAPDAAAERAELLALLRAHDAAWNAHDPEALSALFAADATVVTPAGRHVQGRAALRALFASPGPTKQTTSHTRLGNVQWLDADTALIDATQTLSAPAAADGAPHPLDGAVAHLVGVVRRADASDGTGSGTGTRYRFVAARPHVQGGAR